MKGVSMAVLVLTVCLSTVTLTSSENAKGFGHSEKACKGKQ